MCHELLQFPMERARLISKIQKRGIPLRCGPVGTPLHLRLGKSVGPHIPFHPSQLPGSCPSAEGRCVRQELFLLSALDMDGISPERAFFMGQAVRDELKEDLRARLPQPQS